MVSDWRDEMRFFGKKQKAEIRPVKATVPEPVKAAPKRKYLPLEIKLLGMEAMDAGLSSKDVSAVIGAAPTTIEKWYRLWRESGTDGFIHSGGTPTIRAASKAIQKRVEQFRRENPDAGVRRISDELKRQEAISVSPETVRTIVNDAGLDNPPPLKKRRPPQIRRFERNLPNAMWQVDITTFELKRMFRVYLIAFIDDHSRYIVGHGLFRQQTAEAVQEVLQGAIGQWGAPREILSDNGRQFASWKGKTQFQKILTRQGIQHVRSAPHHPMTLGKIERFWKTIKEEFLDDSVFASFADARQKIDHWIGYYNHQRPHQGIGGAAPADKFYGIAGDVEEALRQGCAENALQLALGQETRPPLYLLGKLGDTDVRVTRKGNEVQVKVGDQVHEKIQVGHAFDLDEEKIYAQLEGHECRGTISDSGDGEGWDDGHQGDLRDVQREPDNIECGDREDGAGGAGGVGAKTSGTKEEEREPIDYGAFERECIFEKRGANVEIEVPVSGGVQRYNESPDGGGQDGES
jgi:transposase InsO family protein